MICAWQISCVDRRLMIELTSMKIRNLKTNTAGLTFVSLCCMSLLGCSDTTLGSRSFEETVGPETIPGAFVQIPLAISDFVFPINLTEQPGYDEDDLDFAISLQTATPTPSTLYRVSAFHYPPPSTALIP